MKIGNNIEAAAKDLCRAKMPAKSGKAGMHEKFESLLAKHDRGAQRKLGAEEKDASLNLVAEPPKPVQFRPVEIEHVEAPRPVTPPAIVEGLVREISVVAADNRQEVNIELNSKTLDSLRIEISKQGGNVCVQFVTSSPEVERVLQRNIDALNQGLAQRGVNATLAIRESAPQSGGGQQHRGGQRGRR